MARNIKQVGSQEVREWANETNWRDELDRPVADRGRMPSGLIDAFNRANKRYFKEYTPTPRPVRADQRDAEPKPERVNRSAQRNASNARSAAKPATEKASAPAVQSAPVQSIDTPDEAERMELEAALAAFSALPADKKNGRPVLVTTKIQTLRYV